MVETLQSDWLTQGPKVTEFEHSLAEHCGSEHAVALSNGTAALHAACVALGLQAGDYLWTTPISFVASANCALYCGAKVDFVDIDANTRNMSVSLLAEKLRQAKKQNCLPKIIVAVHFAGQPCDMLSIHTLACEYGVHLIEDAAHAIGGSYHGHAIGNTEYSDICTFSFHPVKTMTTGEGGAALCNSEVLDQRMRQFACHGITRDTEALDFTPDGAWYYEQQSLGMNFRLSDLQAALGIVQLGRLPGFVEKRRELVARYHQLLAGLPLVLPSEQENVTSAWHLYVIELTRDDASYRQKVFDFLRANNIGVNVHYIPIHLQPYYRNQGFGVGDFPVAETYYRSSITLPLYPDLSFAQQDEVVNVLIEALQ